MSDNPTTENEYLEFVKEQKEIFDKLNLDKERLKQENVEFKKIISMGYSFFRLLDIEMNNSFEIELEENEELKFISKIIESGRSIFSNIIEQEL